MAERTIKLLLGMDISGLQSQARAATAAMADFSKKSVSHIEKNSSSITDLSDKVGVVGVSLVALAGTAVTRFAQFDKAMSSVAATGEDARGSLDALRAAAIDAGAETAFSAQEAAGAIEQLAKAGVSAKDILGGGLDGALSLAAAGEIEVGEAAEIAASAMTQFNLKGTDVGHVADLLAAGAGKAQGGVTDMGAALNQAGLIAGQVGLSIEETTGSLAAMASAGLTGSDAGTSLKTSLIALSSPSAVARKEMDKLGISAYDANGEFIGMEALAGQLQTRLGGLTDEQRNSALATIFGTDALRTANVLYSEGAAGIGQWTDAVNEQGYAAETAAAQTDNLIGDVERLGGSLDSVFIQAGSGANGGLRSIVQGTEAVVDGLGQIPGPALSATTAIAGAGGLALLGVAGLGKLAVGAVEAKSAMTALNISTRTASLTAGALGGALAIGTIAFTVWAQNAADAKARTEEFQATLDSLGASTDATISAINENLSANQNDFFDNLLGDDPESLIDRAERIGLAVEDLQGYILGNADATEKVTQATRDYIAAQGDDLTTMDIRAQAGRFLTDSLDAEAGALTDAQRAAAQKQLADEAAGVAAEGMAGATEGATEAIDKNSEAIAKNLSLAAEAAGVILSEREAQRSLEAAFDDATASIEENGRTLDDTTEKGRANEAALDAVASGAWDVVESMYAAGASGKELSGRMGEAREAFIRTARAAGATKAEANALADELHLVPSDVETILKARDQATGTIDRVKGELQGLQNKTITITTIRQVLGSDKGGASQYVMRRAGGGPAIGPGTGTSDSIPALLSNGEHVWTAAEVQAVGGQAAMYRMRSAAQSGLLRFASGGAVGQAESEVRRAQRLSLSARRALSDARRAERNARLESTKREAEKRVAKAEQLLNDRQEAVNDARAKVERLREEASSLRTDLRRGNVRDSVTGGLSGALGVTDQLRDLAASGDVSRFGSRRLSNIAGSAEKALTGLYKQAELIDKRIDSATSNFEKWKGIADGVSSSISGAFSLGDVSGGVDPWSGKEKQATGKGLLAASQEYQTKARNLVLKLRALQEAGYGTAILQEVARQGVDGGVAMADALLQLSPADAKALQASQEMIGFYAGRAGIAATDDQVTAAARAVEAAEAQAAAIDKNIDRWAEKLGSAMARALGIKARASGGPVTAGHGYLVNEDTPRSELFIPSQSGYVLNNRQMGNLSAGGPSVTHNWNITNIHPVNEAASVTAAKAARSLANVGRR